MKYVYILKSINDPHHHYTGIKSDLKQRLKMHNSGEVQHTKKFAPWKIETYISFTSEQKALGFEKYLKSGSGRAFAKRHF